MVACMSVSVSADASYIYRYEGNNFDEFSTPSPYDTTMALMAEFTLSSLIPPESEPPRESRRLLGLSHAAIAV